ncbi:cupin domain-containing protein [Leucobacter japonicus]|uniref:cupin domain-containing protein n=1 Tax=Leucobacter japonicus TaxID=1461259 RepID=UPI0009E52F4D|nr:cupin domain-containing protein [Leucobacter japonicus]
MSFTPSFRAPAIALVLAAAAVLTGCSATSAVGADSEADAAPAAAVETTLPPVSEALSFPAADLDWVELPGSGGVQYANVRGDLAGSGPYEAFVNFPAGADNPFHTHSQDLPTVVLDGTFYAVIDGERVEYGPGSYYDLPADLEHFSGCTAEKDCLLFQYQADHFDLDAVDEK